VIIVDQLPRNATGKVLRRELRSAPPANANMTGEAKPAQEG